MLLYQWTLLTPIILTIYTSIQSLNVSIQIIYNLLMNISLLNLSFLLRRTVNDLNSTDSLLNITYRSLYTATKVAALAPAEVKALFGLQVRIKGFLTKMGSIQIQFW